MKVSSSGCLEFLRDEGVAGDEFKSRMTNSELAQLQLFHGCNRAKLVSDFAHVIINFNVFLYNEGDKVVMADVDGALIPVITILWHSRH